MYFMRIRPLQIGLGSKNVEALSFQFQTMRRKSLGARKRRPSATPSSPSAIPLLSTVKVFSVHLQHSHLLARLFCLTLTI